MQWEKCLTERELRHEGEYLELVLPSVDNISSKCYGRTRACVALEPLLQINAEHPLSVCHLDMGIWTSLSVSWDTGSPLRWECCWHWSHHSGDCLVTTDWFLWRLMDGCLFIQQVMCWFAKLWGFSRESEWASQVAPGDEVWQGPS